MRRSLVLVVSVLAAAMLVAQASPAEVAPVVAAQGYYIEPGADATDEVVGRAVSDARSSGSRFYAVVLAVEPPSGATFYADSILDRLPNQEGTVLVVAPATVGWAKNLDDTWSDAELNAALEASLDGATSNDVVTIFVGELVGTSSTTSGGGNGLWIFLGLVLVIGGVIAFFVWRSSRRRDELAAEQLADLKEKARAQIDAIANDILDDEDEVAEAADPEAASHFQAATTIYAAAAERLEGATTAAEVVEIAADLDEAIWNLDAAEAILDGHPPPPKPKPPTAPAPPTAAAPEPGTTDEVPPLPEYQRRSTRRSGFGAEDMISTVVAMQAMRALSGGRSRSSGRSTSRSSSSRGRSSSGRSRGGGRRRG